MPRGRPKKQATTTAIEPVQKMAIHAVTEQKWWGKLSSEEQKTIQSEGLELATALLNYGRSRLAVGEHLYKIRETLEPHKLFERFLKTFHFSRRTAYRYIAGYENATKHLSGTIVQAAMARGINIVGDSDEKPLGVYTTAVTKLPPPKEPDQVQANTWLDQIEQVRKQTKAAPTLVMPSVPQDPDTLLKECYRFCSNRFKKLPTNHKTRANWVRSLVGLLLADLGVGSAQSFSPMAVPEDFKGERGRPRLVASA